MKVLVTGSNGQLGHDVVLELRKNNIDCLGIDKEDLDITNETRLKNYLISESPDVIIHCAAYTQVDKAEDDKEVCYNINVLGTRYLAEYAAINNIKMLYVSTDYVFDGSKIESYEVTDQVKPMSVYGMTKYQGELEMEIVAKKFIVRISWVFGLNGQNFVKTMLRLFENKQELNVVSDQIGSPTYTKDLSTLIIKMICSDKYGIYHATNEGFTSWYGFAKKIALIANKDIEIKPILSENYPQKAYRPKNSRLSKESLVKNGFNKLPNWEDALKRYLEEMRK